MFRFIENLLNDVKMKKNLILMVVLFTGTFIFTSCEENIPNKDNPAYFVNLVTQAVGPTLGDQAINAVDNFIESYYTDSFSVKPVDGISHMLKTGIQQVVEFGNNGYPDFNGRIITGSVLVSKIDSQSWSYYFRNVTISGNSVRSVRNVTRISENTYEINSVDTVVLLNGETFYRNWKRTKVLNCETGLCPPNCKNCCLISGSVSCRNSSGEIFEVKILQPLQVKEGYQYYTRGIIETTSSKGVQVLDFGFGEKDNLATGTINGKTQIIELNW